MTAAVVHDLARAKAASTSPVRDRAAALRQARLLLAPSLKGREAPPYPVAALGPLAAAAQAIAEHGQMQPAMVGQSLLGAASLLTQGLHDVRTMAGIKPLSLYLLTMAYSGEGKSTADRAALATVKAAERDAGLRYRAELLAYKAAVRALKKDEAEPEAPRSPYRLVRDATVEGLRRDLETGPMSQGVFTDEAAAILGGYGMTAEHKAKTASTFSGLWDSGELSVSRSIGGRIELHGRRLAMHWLIQPAGAAAALGDPLLSELGFWPRFLLAWPAECEPRKARVFEPEKLPEVAAYWRRCAELLAEPLPVDGVPMPVLELDTEARELIGAAFERAEVASRRGRLRPVKPYGLRATEQACRVAGVLAAFSGRAVIGAEDARSALALVDYSIATWQAVVEEGAGDPTGANALRLYEWLTDPKHCPGWQAPGARIVNAGPACVRSKDKRDAAVELLQAVGLAHRTDKGLVLALGPEDRTGGHHGRA